MRPSRGRVANGAVTQPWPEPISFQMTNCQGPMARRVADLRLAQGIISAPDACDPRWVPVPLQGPALKRPIRVAAVRDPAGAGIDSHVRAGIDRAAGWLADAGYEVVDVEPPEITKVAQCWFDAIWADVGAMWPGMQPITGDGERGFVEACLAQGVFKPVDQTAQRAAWVEVYQHGSLVKHCSGPRLVPPFPVTRRIGGELLDRAGGTARRGIHCAWIRRHKRLREKSHDEWLAECSASSRDYDRAHMRLPKPIS